jgi:hypothetical protein
LQTSSSCDFPNLNSSCQIFGFPIVDGVAVVDAEVDGIDSDTMDDYWVQGLAHFESFVCGVPVDRGVPEGLGLFNRSELKVELVLSDISHNQNFTLFTSKVGKLGRQVT